MKVGKKYKVGFTGVDCAAELECLAIVKTGHAVVHSKKLGGGSLVFTIHPDLFNHYVEIKEPVTITKWTYAYKYGYDGSGIYMDLELFESEDEAINDCVNFQCRTLIKTVKVEYTDAD